MATKAIHAFEAGLAGAASVTLIHEAIRKIEPNAPRMDLLGESALVQLLKKLDVKPPQKDDRYSWAMAGDLLSNTLYYSLAGSGKAKNAWVRGAALGFAAGQGAVFLPKPMGLPTSPSNRTLQTQLMTIGYYTLGGMITSAVFQWLENKSDQM